MIKNCFNLRPLDIIMIPQLEEKYQQLTQAQKDIFCGYGLRQIKHFVELNLPKIESCLPDGAQVVGINAEGRIQAENMQTGAIFLWISDQQWQAANLHSLHIDLKQDFIQIWQLLDLKQQDLIDLSHIHRDFLQQLSEQSIRP